MKTKSMEIKELFLNLFFPRSCLFCQREGDFLCSDCSSLLEISEQNFCLCPEPIRLPETGKCRRCQKKSLNGLYFAANYQNFFCQNLIQKFKYTPFIKELARPLASLIISHFQLQGKSPEKDFFFIAIPQTKGKLRWRGFNQAEEIARELSNFWQISLILDCLIKIKETLPQVELSEKERRENPKGAFLVKDKEKIKNKKILLVDDVYTTGSTMEEAARALKTSGAKEVWGIVVARG